MKTKFTFCILFTVFYSKAQNLVPKNHCYIKIKLFQFIVFFCSLHVNAINITIIESQTGNTWAVQDTVWRFVANGMGYNATIVAQNTLDNFANLNSTDVLVVASSSISFTSTNHLNTIKQFVLSGRPAYIQSEYQTSHQGNITFDSLMQSVGANFNWTTSINGSLIPMNVLGTLSTSPNNVPILNYFHYGCAGTGAGVEKFLEYNGNFFGFCYSDITLSNGTVITISDADWVWNNISHALMENILYRLVNSIYSSIHNTKTNNYLLNIFPNPVENELKVQNVKCKINELRIYNITRELLSSKRFDAKETSIDLSILAKGIYFVAIETEEGEISKKIIKE